MSQLRFRFQEKRRPDDYATWVAEHLSWPLPPDLVIAGPQLTWDWNEDGSDVKKLHEYLDTFRQTEGRVVLMAKKEEHEKLDSAPAWQQEPVYGTGFSVKNFDQEFIKEVSIECLCRPFHQLTIFTVVGECTQPAATTIPSRA